MKFLCSIRSVYGIVLLSLLGVGCAPKIYLIDRQTVLEEEAAGEWPEFEKKLIEQSQAKGPTPYSKADLGARNQPLYEVLNGEWESPTE
jgi:hypothetical protein